MYSSRGHFIQYSMFGESHGPAIGMTIHGFPEGISVDHQAIARALKQRRTGGAFASQRKEMDQVVWLSGLKNDVTTGAPITFMIENKDHKPKDYDQHNRVVRPSHADYPASVRYQGFNDIHGGGMFSGRLTAVYVVAGTLCRQWLSIYGVTLRSYLSQLGKISLPQSSVTQSPEPLEDPSWLASLTPQWRTMVNEILQAAQSDGDSIGGQVRLTVDNVPVGIGEPQLHSLESELSGWLFSIPGVKALSFGIGEAFASANGSKVNDCAYYDGDQVKHRTNHNGGIFGGLSNGMPIELQVTFKPTPSIYKAQQSIDLTREQNATLEITGRHDPAFVIRTPVVVECVVAMCLTDLMSRVQRRK